MTREEIITEIKQVKNNNILIIAGTGLGKTRISLEKCSSLNAKKVLIVSPTLYIIDSWKQEINKWNKQTCDYTYTTYASLHKYVIDTYDVVIYDEAHHITDRVLEIIPFIKTSNNILLSATINRNKLSELKTIFRQLFIYKVPLITAIEEGLLPDPKIILIPLTLNNENLTERIIKNPKGSRTIIVSYQERFNTKNKSIRYEIPCTERLYYNDLSNLVDYYKRLSMGGSVVFKNLWLQTAGNRLKWLANKKTVFVRELLSTLKQKKTLTFCSSIEQTELLGKNCIHSKNKLSDKVYTAFNEDKIKHITAVAMLDEGINLNNCQIGIFANINASERMQCQRMGRILRHKKPIIIIPYYKNTREQEIVEKMIEGYNKELIKTVHNLKELEDEVRN